jgi:multiple sugar transport system permease protein
LLEVRKNNRPAIETKSIKDRLVSRLDATFKYWALGPAVILLVALTLYPMLLLIRMSVSEVEFVAGGFEYAFNPARNVRILLNDWIAWEAYKNTLIFVAAVIVAQMILGFILAYLASRVGTGKRIIRTIMVLPILVPPVAIGSMWRLMYTYDFGIFNQILRTVGLPPQPWLGSPDLAMLSVIIVDVWHWVPFVFLIALAGFEALDTEVIEAASVDGASGRQMIRYIILPLMWPVLSVALMFRTIGAFKVFDEIFLLTSGGPGTSTVVISWYIYKVMFRDFRLGYGALLSILTILVISVFVFTYRRSRWTKGWEE